VRHDATAKYFYPRRPPHDLMLDVTSSSLSAYIQDEHHLGSAVSVLAGLRMDNYSRTEDALSPRAAVILRPWRDGTVKLLYGYAFRAPNVYEAGVETMSYLHNPNLRPERIQTMEAVWQQRLGARALWTASVFNYHIHDLIELTVDSTTAMYQYRNIGKARSTGFEAGIDARLGAGVQGFLNYTYQRTIDEESGERLTNSPAHLVKGGLSARPVAWLGAGIVARHESSRRTLYGTTTDPYFLADLHLELSPFRGGAERAPSLQVRVENLFDADYATPGGVEHRQPAIRQDGRTVMVELRVGF
jgi:outer membrane receptor protein involved in Fe transport